MLIKDPVQKLGAQGMIFSCIDVDGTYGTSTGASTAHRAILVHARVGTRSTFDMLGGDDARESASYTALSYEPP